MAKQIKRGPPEPKTESLEVAVRSGATPSMGALFGLSKGYDSMRSNFHEIDIVSVRPNPNQARSHIDEEGIASLAASIDKHGIQQPIIVRRIDGAYELVAGHRRLAAHVYLGRQTIPAFVTDGDTEEIALVENVQRVDLDSVDLARALDRLVKAGRTQEDVGRIAGMSRGTVTQIIGILRLPPDILDEYHSVSDTVPRSTLVELSALTDADRIKKLWHKAMSGGLSRDEVREERKSVKESVDSAEPNAPKAGNGRTLRTVGQSLKAFAKVVKDLKENRAALENEHRERLRELKEEIEALLT